MAVESNVRKRTLEMADRWLEMWGASERGEEVQADTDGSTAGTDRPADDPGSAVFKIAQAGMAVQSFREGLLGGLVMVELARFVWVQQGKLKDFESQHRQVEQVFQMFAYSWKQRMAFLGDRKRDVRERLADMILDVFYKLPQADRTGITPEAAKAHENMADKSGTGVAVVELRPHSTPSRAEIASTAIVVATRKRGKIQVQTEQNAC